MSFREYDHGREHVTDRFQLPDDSHPGWGRLLDDLTDDELARDRRAAAAATFDGLRLIVRICEAREVRR